MKRVREIVVSNVEIEDKFSWWFNTNDSQLYYFTLGKWSTLFGTASFTLDGLMSKEDKEVLSSLSIGSSVVTVPTYADLESYAVKSEVILYVVKATNKIYRFSNNGPIEINTFYFNSLEDVKILLGVGVYYVIVEHETYILYISQVGSQLTYILHSPKKYIECSYNTINSEWSDWVTTSYDAAGAILDIQNWVNAQVALQNTTLSSMLEQITTIANSSASNFNILYSSLNSLSLDVTNVKNNITTINDKISQINNTIVALTQANSTLNNRVLNLENNYASKTWVNGNFATINNLNIASNQINTNSLIIQGLIPRVETLEEDVAALQSISSSYMLKSEADNTYATIDALSSLALQTLNNSDLINLHSILISNLQNNNITLTDLDNINTQIAELVSNINSLYEISATKIALNTTNNNLVSLETRVVVLEDNKADKATTLEGYGITDAYTKVEVDAKVASVYTYKGTIADYATLLTLTNMLVGDVYNLLSTGENFSWTDSAWEPLAGIIDLSAYLEKTEAATIYETKSNVAALLITTNANTSAIVDIQNSQLEIEEAVSDLTIALESFLTKVDATTLYTTKTLFNITADQVILNTSAISSLLTLKADKAFTLSGYGITDAEPAIVKLTAFNKNFGTTSGTVSEGNHTHTFESLTSKPNTLSGYGITDVPSDNKTYGRLNGDWTQIDTSGGGGGGVSIIPITRSDLKALRDAGTLVPGQSYRIIDYECIVDLEDIQSAGHDFDIVVTALSTNELSESAKCVKKAGDTYFENAPLELWEIKYCIDNDTTRFAWVHAENGKGVIYYMADNLGNKCSYDFKNIMFKRFKISSALIDHPSCNKLVGKYYGSMHLLSSPYVTVDLSDFQWCYTFDYVDPTSLHYDVSILEVLLMNNDLNSEFIHPEMLFDNICLTDDLSNIWGRLKIVGYGNTILSDSSNIIADKLFVCNIILKSVLNFLAPGVTSFSIIDDNSSSILFSQYTDSVIIPHSTMGLTFIGQSAEIIFDKQVVNTVIDSSARLRINAPLFSNIQNIRIKKLVNDELTILDLNLSPSDQEWVIAKNSSGVIKQYCPEDLVP